MIKTIIKRDGNKEPFMPEKVNGWGEWAATNLPRVDWPTIVLNATSKLPEECTSEALQKMLIDECLAMRSWQYSRMAGRLYAIMQRKQSFGSMNPPSIASVHKQLAEKGLISEEFYKSYSQGDQYDTIEHMIDHNRDFDYAQYQHQQFRDKYCLQDRVEGIAYETPQLTYMRVAMALAINEDQLNRLAFVKLYYNAFSQNKINLPTPYLVNAGTDNGGYISCCLYESDDDAKSLATGDHIAYMMTVASAGIGSHIKTRSIGQPVRGGIISHQGKYPYYRALASAVTANLQNGRGGAATATYTVYDPEIKMIQALKNPMTPIARGNRMLDYCMAYNTFFIKKAAKGEKYHTFDYKKCPEIYKALYDADDAMFAQLYEKAVEEGRYEEELDAREILLQALSEAVETGRHYLLNLTEANRHTPFKEQIRMTNLCVAPDTIIRVRAEDTHEEMEIEIADFVKIFHTADFEVLTINADGERVWKLCKAAFKTGTAFEMLEVTYNGKKVQCTPEHKILTKNRGWVQAQHLKEDDVLVDGEDTTAPTITFRVLMLDEAMPVYDLTVDEEHSFLANGIVVHNCAEITLPTDAFRDVRELYEEQEYHDIDGEIAMCAIAGINVDNIEDDDDYRQCAFLSLRAIDAAIHQTQFPFPAATRTARARLSAGVGIVGLAHYLAKRNLDYQTGKQAIHDLAEKHYYYLLEASLMLGKEKGNAKWIDRTKWVDGWLPIDDYEALKEKFTNNGIHFELKQDWELLREKIRENGGIRNSVLVAHMPAESSSISSGTTNGLYPARNTFLLKTNGTKSLSYVVPDSEDLHYQSAWDIPSNDMIDCYALVQKFTDQAISADLWINVVGAERIEARKLLSDFFRMNSLGVKTRYYLNSRTSKQDEGDARGCASGACSL